MSWSINHTIHKYLLQSLCIDCNPNKETVIFEDFNINWEETPVIRSFWEFQIRVGSDVRENFEKDGEIFIKTLKKNLTK